jgi:hypothetical protein
VLDRSNVILRGTVGSQAYGLAHEGSDVDKAGIYLAPVKTVLGLRGPQAVSDSLHTNDPDVTLHEAGKFVGLALQANPSVLEILFLSEYDTLTPAGQDLIDHREIFLSAKNIRARYGGYVKAQVERLIRRNEEGKEGFSSDVRARTEKHGRHCIRLIFQASDLLRDGTMNVNVGEYRRAIFLLGERAARDPQSFHKLVTETLLPSLDKIDTQLPEEPDREAAEELLVRLRLEYGCL